MGVIRVIFKKFRNTYLLLMGLLSNLYFLVLFLKDWILQNFTTAKLCGTNYTQINYIFIYEFPISKQVTLMREKKDRKQKCSTKIKFQVFFFFINIFCWFSNIVLCTQKMLRSYSLIFMDMSIVFFHFSCFMGSFDSICFCSVLLFYLPQTKCLKQAKLNHLSFLYCYLKTKIQKII